MLVCRANNYTFIHCYLKWSCCPFTENSLLLHCKRWWMMLGHFMYLFIILYIFMNLKVFCQVEHITNYKALFTKIGWKTQEKARLWAKKLTSLNLRIASFKWEMMHNGQTYPSGTHLHKKYRKAVQCNGKTCKALPLYIGCAQWWQAERCCYFLCFCKTFTLNTTLLLVIFIQALKRNVYLLAKKYLAIMLIAYDFWILYTEYVWDKYCTILYLYIFSEQVCFTFTPLTTSCMPYLE